MQNILFIDWENFKKKIKTVLNQENITENFNWHEYNFKDLFDQVLQGIKIDRKILYAAQLTFCPSTAKKSKELIENQRLLKTYLEKQNFEFVYAGRVSQNNDTSHKGKMIFKEKGVDVRIAVDMIKMAFKNELQTTILASSDSDLQPAIKTLKEVEKLNNKKIEIIYLGFEIEHNKGLSYTTDRTILIRNAEVLKFLPQKLL